MARTRAFMPLGGGVHRGSELSAPPDAFRVLDNAEVSEDVLRVRRGRTRVNNTAPKATCLEGRLAWNGYGLIKAHADLNPSTTQFTLEAIVRLPKITTYATSATYYPIVYRGGDGIASGTRFIYLLDIVSTATATQARARFIEILTAAGGETYRELLYTLPTVTEGTVGSVTPMRWPMVRSPVRATWRRMSAADIPSPSKV